MDWPGWPAIAAVLVLAACEQKVEVQLDPGVVEWVTYRSDELGISFEHPEQWVAARHGNSIALEGDRATAVRVTVTSSDEARRRGLWGRTPIVRTERVGGLEYDFYRYRHYDGPVYVATLAFVTEYGGLDVGVEFRTRAEEPGPVERRILESLKLER